MNESIATARTSILVVDDHPENVVALQAMLSRTDYDVVGAASGAEALKKVLKHDFAAILLDVLMPAMDGFETARRIRQREASRSIPIIFLTASAAEATLVYRGYAVGAVDYLFKPLDPDIVRAKVAVFVDLFRKTQRIREQEEQLREAERRRSEQAIREREVLYEATFNEAAIGIGLTATDGRWLRVNRKLCEIFGYSALEILQRRLQDVTHPEDVAQGVAALRQMLSGDLDSCRREQRCLDKRGRVLWVNLSLSPLRGAEGTGQFITVVEDITERKLAADRQRVLSAVSERLLRSLDYRQGLAEIAANIVPALADWCVLEVNGLDSEPNAVSAMHADPARTPLVRQAWERAAGDPSCSLVAALRSDQHALVPSMAEAGLGGYVADPRTRALLQEVGCDSAVVVPLVAHGGRFGAIGLFSASAGRRYDAADLAFAEELSLRLALAIENARLYQAAQAAVSMRDEFLSIASHELRTPLTPIQITFQRLLREGSRERLERVAPDRLRHMLTRSERQVHRLTALIDDLLDVSRISAGRLRLQREQLDLVEVTRDVMNRFGDELARAECTAELRTEARVLGCWDRLRLEQVITNLIANAIKYGAGKPIEVAVASAGPLARLSVRDHGIGIDAQSISRIFERFERAVSSRSYGGLGLGLYITRQIVEAHGGSIRVSSELGSGSVFVVELPIDSTESTHHEPGDARGREEHGQQAWSG